MMLYITLYFLSIVFVYGVRVYACVCLCDSKCDTLFVSVLVLQRHISVLVCLLQTMKDKENLN